MSYDIYLRAEKCPHCGRPGDEPDLPDPTYNLTPIFHLALTGEPMPSPEKSEFQAVVLGEQTELPRGLRVLCGMAARDTVSQLSAALARLDDPSRCAEFKALEPKNGWGTVRDAVYVLMRLRESALSYPDNVWEIH